MDVLNLECFHSAKGQDWLLKARGVSIVEGERKTNGGIVNPQREHLRVGQYYYRFVSASMPQRYKLGGAWWIEFDTLNTIYSRFRETGPNHNSRTLRGTGPAASTFREWLALTYEWNSIQKIVVAQLAARLDAYTGAGRIARGAHVFDTRAFGYAPHLSNHFSIKQLCVPEVWMHEKAAFPRHAIVPFSQIAEVAAGRVR